MTEIWTAVADPYGAQRYGVNRIENVPLSDSDPRLHLSQPVTASTICIASFDLSAYTALIVSVYSTLLVLAVAPFLSLSVPIFGI